MENFTITPALKFFTTFTIFTEININFTILSEILYIIINRIRDSLMVILSQSI